MKPLPLFIFALILPTLAGCDSAEKKAQNEAEANALRQSSFDNMVAIKGGRFQMGDFGDLVELKIPYSSDPTTKPLHWVTLSDFKMGKYRVTWGEFNRWLALQGRDKTDYYLDIFNNPYANKDKLGDDYPAKVSWADAKAYCQWLGKETQRHTDLPTEAQWEYAARSGGQLLIYGNSDNKLYYDDDPKRNFVSFNKPVGSFAPNPIGLYDMMGNGRDWINDWYATDYYQHSPEENPQGPETGKKKVVRGYFSSVDGMLTITRWGRDPNHKYGGGFRCVENL